MHKKYECICFLTHICLSIRLRIGVSDWKRGPTSTALSSLWATASTPWAKKMGASTSTTETASWPDYWRYSNINYREQTVENTLTVCGHSEVIYVLLILLMALIDRTRWAGTAGRSWSPTLAPPPWLLRSLVTRWRTLTVPKAYAHGWELTFDLYALSLSTTRKIRKDWISWCNEMFHINTPSL